MVALEIAVIIVFILHLVMVTVDWYGRKKQDKWVTANRKAHRIVIYARDAAEFQKALELRDIIASITKLYSTSRVEMDNSFIFDDDSSITVTMQREVPEGDIYYIPKDYKKYDEVKHSKKTVYYY